MGKVPFTHPSLDSSSFFIFISDISPQVSLLWVVKFHQWSSPTLQVRSGLSKHVLFLHSTHHVCYVVSSIPLWWMHEASEWGLSSWLDGKLQEHHYCHLLDGGSRYRTWIQSLLNPSCSPDFTFPLGLTPLFLCPHLSEQWPSSNRHCLIPLVAQGALFPVSPSHSLAITCLGSLHQGQKQQLPASTSKAIIRTLLLPIKDRSLHAVLFLNAHRSITGKVTFAQSIPQSTCLTAHSSPGSELIEVLIWLNGRKNWNQREWMRKKRVSIWPQAESDFLFWQMSQWICNG